MNELTTSAELLLIADKIIGMKGPIMLDTGILAHSLDYDGDLIDDIIPIGEQDQPITLKQFIKAFNDIKKNNKFKQEMNSGRTYAFAGIGISNDTSNGTRCYLSWDS